MRRAIALLLVVGLAAGLTAWAAVSQVATAGWQAPPPADAVVLFDGTGYAAWNHDKWPLADGVMTVRGGGSLRTRESFGDFQLHLEFSLPDMPDKSGQAKANSGVYIHGLYEVQILDTSQHPRPENWGCGGIYRLLAPLVNACLPPEQWQSFDLLFRAPRLADDGVVTEPARISVVHNGIFIHHDQPIRPTGAASSRPPVAAGPIVLQDHGNPVSFRNVWLRRMAL